WAKPDRQLQAQPVLTLLLHAVLPVRRQRTPAWCCSTKQLPHQIVSTEPSCANADWFLAKSASGKVPALQEPDGSVLEDSLVTSRHLEETHRESALYPKQRRQASGRWMALFGVSGDEKKAAFEQLVTELESMQSTLGDSKFFAGSESVQMADLMIWPWFERLKPSCSLAGFSGARGAAEIADVLDGQDGAAAGGSGDARNTDEAHVEFTRSLLANQPKYDGY
uniref:GST N-terminal domain-containing protein n=1 Tax=Macrostomum lignano TaxID=282301 RepID=A0A1I8FS99_9PLAT